MHEESSTFGLNRDKLAKLWGLGVDLPQEAPAPDCNQDKAELLRGELAESLPLEAGLARMLPDILSVVCDKLRPFTGWSLHTLLLDPQTELSVLETIKDLYKKRSASIALDPMREITTLIYYAAIASALVHHGAMISKLSYPDLEQSFAQLAASDWVPGDVGRLFSQAHECVLRHARMPRTHDE